MTVAGNARARAWATKTQSNDGQRQPLAARPPPEVAKIPPRAATRSPSALPAQPQPRAAATPTQPTTISRLYRAMWMCRNDPATDPNQHIAGSHGVRERGLCKHDLGRHVHGFPAGPRQPPASATPTNAAAKSATVATRCGARSTRRTNAAVTNTGTQSGCGHGSHPPLFAVPYLFTSGVVVRVFWWFDVPIFPLPQRPTSRKSNKHAEMSAALRQSVYGKRSGVTAPPQPRHETDVTRS